MKKKKCNYGGTITPKRAIDMLPNRLPLVNIKPVQLNKSLGGDLLQTGVSFIPGLGQILSPLVGLVDSQITEEPVKAPEPLKLNMNPFGKLKNGGIINDGFKQYNTGSHSSGNDLSVDEQGNPDPNGSSSVQNKENSFAVKGRQYVMSDVLKNPKTGNTFNKDAMAVNKKYPNARQSLDQRKALDLEMQILASLNDKQRDIQLDKELKYGGYPENGDPTIPASDNLQFYASPETLNGVTVPTLAMPTQVQSNKMVSTNMDTSASEPGLDTTEFGNPITLGSDVIQSPANPTVATQRSESSDILGSKTANAIGMGLKGAALLGSVVDAFRPAEKEKLILPDYQKADNYVKSANIDYTQAKQDAQGVSNVAAQTNRSLSSNAASYQGREAARLAQLSDAMGRISEAQNNAQSQLNLHKGSYEQSKAVDTANRKYQNQQNQQMNDANSRLFDRDLMTNLSELGTSFNRYGETQKMIKNNTELSKFELNQALTLLNARYPSFKVDDKVIELLKSGASVDEIIKMKS